MSDLISRTALLADIECTIAESGCVNHTGEIMDCIRYAPAVAMKPVRHGHWVITYDDVCGEAPQPVVTCSECEKMGLAGESCFCPGCGAMMDGEVVRL